MFVRSPVSLCIVSAMSRAAVPAGSRCLPLVLDWPAGLRLERELLLDTESEDRLSLRALWLSLLRTEEAVDLEYSLLLLLLIQWRPRLTGERLRGLTVLSSRLRSVGEAERDLERQHEDRRE